MNLYSIYASKERKPLDLMIIKQGFSIRPLIFNFFWAIFHKMWLIVALFIAANFIVFSFYNTENTFIMDTIQFFVFGFFSAELREFYAKKQGMELDDIILARSEEEAELKYLTRKNTD